MSSKKEVNIVLISPSDVNEEINEIKEYFDGLRKSLEYIININVKHWIDTPEGMIENGIFQNKIEETLGFENCDIVICIFGYTLGTKVNDEYRTEAELDKVIDLYKENNKPDAFVYFKEWKDHKHISSAIDIFSELENLKKRWGEKLNHKDFKSKKELIHRINQRIVRFLLEKNNKIDFSSLRFKVMLSTNEYLEQLAYLISIAENEVYYTSTKMASTTDSRYGEKQNLIVESAKRFKKKYPEREHFGIIDSEDSTIIGSIELRKEVEDIVLKFHKNLNTIGFNFFISDSKHIVIKFHNNKDRNEFSIYTENKDLTERFKQYFYDLWHDSTSMKEHINYKKDQSLIDMFKDIGLGNSINEIDDFFTILDSIDQKSYPLPYHTLGSVFDKNIYVKDIFPYSSDYQFDNILKLYSENINRYFINNLISLSTIKAVRKSIVENIPIDYSRYSETFFYMFFIANYMKTVHSLELTKDYLKFNDLKILDIGGGGGASFIATQNFLDNNNIKCIQLDIVDSSNEQLEISKKFDNTKLAVKYSCIDINDYLENTDIKYDLIIASNSFCELKTIYMTSLLKKIKNCLSIDGLLLTIERVESGVYEKFSSEEVDFNQLSYIYKNERYKMEEKFYEINKVLEGNSKTNLINYIKTGYTLRYGLYK